MGRYFLDIAIALQIRTRYVEWNIWGVNDTVEERQEFRNNFGYAVGNEDLIAVEVDFVALYLDVFLDFRKVQDPR